MKIDTGFLKNNPQFSTLTNAEVVAELKKTKWISGEIWKVQEILVSTGELAAIRITAQNSDLENNVRGLCYTIIDTVTSAQLQHIDCTNVEYQVKFTTMLSQALSLGLISQESVDKINAIFQVPFYPGIPDVQEEDIAETRAAIVKESELSVLQTAIETQHSKWTYALIAIRDGNGIIPSWENFLVANPVS